MTRRARYSSYYHLKFKGLTNCIYCGELATEKDHVMAVHYVQGIELWRSEIYKKFLPHGFCLVPSCISCNSIAGGRGFTNILIKRAYIQKKLRKKYRKQLEAQAWEERELREIEGYVLRTGVRALENQSRRLMRRANWPYSRKWKDLDSSHLNEEAKKVKTWQLKYLDSDHSDEKTDEELDLSSFDEEDKEEEIIDLEVEIDVKLKSTKKNYHEIEEIQEELLELLENEIKKSREKEDEQLIHLENKIKKYKEEMRKLKKMCPYLSSGA